nr:reverse transcriptase domain, reverse transcriptase zinc-binding domain protein [Tanacetum cinerariifolium]
MAALNHFSSRFHEEKPIRPKFRSDYFRRLDREDVTMLESAFTMEEVKAAVWDCSSSKSSGPDGLNFKFIKRQILDGSLIANEIVNFSKKAGMNMLLFKVDFEKAFDSVNWDFLLDVMTQMNFGSPLKELKMERGLRQGDPLSLFLFLIVAEALQVMCIEACNKGISRGLYLADEGVNISLLQYADDTLFFGEWSKSNALHLVHILDYFHDVSGLKINLEKSRLFGIGIPLEDVVNVARAISCTHDSLPFTYLGLPVRKKLRKVKAWSEVIDRFSKCLATWKSKLLSIRGRLTLVKSVLGSLPFYYLSIFRVP